MTVRSSATYQDVFLRAAEYVERGWSRYADAKDSTGYPVEYQSDSATAWCAEGAIRRACFDYQRSGIMAVSVARRQKSKLAEWNDAPERTQAEVVAWLRELASQWE